MRFRPSTKSWSSGSRNGPNSASPKASTGATARAPNTDYINATKDLIFKERERVTAALRAIPGPKVYDPVANFVLSRITKENVDADILFDKAIRKNMMIRNCSSFPFLDNTYFRICFMNPADNDRLLALIRETVK